ncbi:hypothetical protein AGABI1DRAFT_128322 [Agaricus bisporus var. burnettii JB137-S8]|uniref:F-box domain-containing protein n=1 Tax=Agaricus bisporus var. burnettii (strain JB137-S8 / ATCC MYA-4627 / FGSC 10392) TaxID=597362 RepID=K5VXG8_AGABU|nr:uncharacterized protein AGABI1DRAFT_128322 [Agaricus bisporus var. burnettii JB137-S8]EKM79159.1 hypothetical protein AGABI1DRAFT_128322 [Agaricus bisporus var. burnettii JB137-S8]
MDDTEREVEGLMSLPNEVLSRIFIYVDDSDIPILQQTLRSVIMTRQFWYNRIHRLCEEHVVSPPEEELKEYSIVQLEKWTMRRIRARSTFPVKLQLRSQYRPILGFYGDIFLVPGGRWLLNFHQDLRVYFVDLDSSNLQLDLLLEARMIDPRVSQYQFNGNRIWIDHNAPRLSFHFEGSLADAEGCIWVYIYQVDLVGHGTGAKLVARLITTFRSPRENNPHGSHALNKRYFVQDRGYMSTPGPGVKIFDYRQTLGRRDYPVMECHTFPSEFYSSEMEFIHEDVLAIRSGSTSFHYNPDTESSFYYIFDIESPTSFKLLHKIEIPQAAVVFSRPCWTSQASLITFVSYPISCDARVLHGLVIPHDSKNHPWMVELGNFVGKERLNMGFKLGIFSSLHCNSEEDTISRFRHEWDYTCALPRIGPAYISILKQDVEHMKTFIAFDEDTGRSVHFDDGNLDVVDIVIAG